MIPVYNATQYSGWSGIFLYLNSISTLFIPGTFFMVFMITFITSLIYQQKTMNLSNPSASFTAAAFLTWVSSIILSLIAGLVLTSYILITSSILIVGFLWLVFSGRE
jgi:hypothetical protein